MPVYYMLSRILSKSDRLTQRQNVQCMHVSSMLVFGSYNFSKDWNRVNRCQREREVLTRKAFGNPRELHRYVDKKVFALSDVRLSSTRTVPASHKSGSPFTANLIEDVGICRLMACSHPRLLLSLSLS